MGYITNFLNNKRIAVDICICIYIYIVYYTYYIYIYLSIYLQKISQQLHLYYILYRCHIHPYTISNYHGISCPLPIDRSARSMPKRPRSNWTSARRLSTVPRMASLGARWRWVLHLFPKNTMKTLLLLTYDNIWMLWMFVFFGGFPCIFWVEQIVC